MGTIIAVTAAAGMGGTGLGGLAAYLFRRGTDRTVSVLLSFAAGMMLAVVCADLLTDAIQAGPGLSALPAASASVLAGCGGIWLLEELVSGLQAGAKRGGLFLAGVVMAAAIALHNLPEGMVIGASYAADLAEAGEDGRMMALVIGLHNIPEGMAVAVPLAAGGASRGRAVLTTAAAGAPTVLGAVLGFWRSEPRPCGSGQRPPTWPSRDQPCRLGADDRRTSRSCRPADPAWDTCSWRSRP